jgi:hypothetical protein
MSKELKKINTYIQRLMYRLSRVYSFFQVYEALMELKAPNIVGESAALANAKTINGYNSFFEPIIGATRDYAILELAKFFDTSDEALTLIKVRNCAEGDGAKLTASDFKEANQNREGIHELVKAYEGITPSDLIDIDNIMLINKELIKRLINYRDKYLAHDDINKPEVVIRIDEIETLFGITEGILQKLSHKLNHSTWEFSPLKEGVKNDTTMVVDHLKRFKPYLLGLLP